MVLATKVLGRTFFCMGLVLVLLLTACSNNEPAAQPINSPESNSQEEADETQDVAVEEPVEDADAAVSDFPPSAFEGRVDGISYGIGNLTEGMLQELGEPEMMDYFAGGLFLSYPGVVFFTDASLDDSGNLIDGTVRSMGFRQEGSLFGVTVGQTFEEIEAVLGMEYHLNRPEDNVNNEFYEGKWSMEYTLGDYLLVFTADEEKGPTAAAYYEMNE